MPVLSVLSQTFNEEESLPIFIASVLQYFDANDVNGELIIVDDASTDSSPAILKKAAQNDSRVRPFQMKENSKRSGAIMVSVLQSKGDIVLIMDADLQDSIQSIPLLVEAIENGADAAIGWRKNRKDSLLKRSTSTIMNTIANLLFSSSFHDMNSSIRAFRNGVLEDIALQHSIRYLPHILVRKGGIVKEIPVVHHQRIYGQSHFGFWNRLPAILDLFKTRFSTHRPSPVPAFTSLTDLRVPYENTAQTRSPVGSVSSQKV